MSIHAMTRCVALFAFFSSLDRLGCAPTTIDAVLPLLLSQWMVHLTGSTLLLATAGSRFSQHFAHRTIVD